MQNFDRDVITAERLLAGSAISFTNQPLLEQLFTSVRAARGPLTLLVGAGISMDAGLPNWAQLVERIECQLPKPDTFSLLAPADLQRRAQLALFAAQRAEPKRSEHDRVREALLGSTVNHLRTGQMAQSLGRLAMVYDGEVRIFTTNFDGLLESSLRDFTARDVESYSLGGHSLSKGKKQFAVRDWKRIPEDERWRAVLHLHGKLAQEESPYLQPLILTESTFSRYGRQIQDFLVKYLSTGTVLIVGMSMTDPNILAPLRLTATSSADRFILTVPDVYRSFGDHLAGSTQAVARCAEFEVEVAKMLANDLAVKPVLLKSYGQVNQVLSDLALASALPEQYSSKVSPSSDRLPYGYRLTRALGGIYRNIGYKPLVGIPQNRTQSEALSRKFRAACAKPMNFLKDEMRAATGATASDEHFGFFFWLRVPGGKSYAGKYEIKLICSSAYHHWEEWSGQNIQTISPLSSYTPALALYWGQPVVHNITSGSRGRWRGSLAFPLVATSHYAMLGSYPLDTLQVGAIAVNTTGVIVGNEATGNSERSVIATWDHERMEAFEELLNDVAKTLVGDF